ncbi:asparaginase [Krasilnikovia sp. M28-CT-15]|uniref:asparaginase n=1 Tax=Krasilnikovia sp. M28-CT-15 TaxID=3373540 RepID=UPI00387697FB
MILAEVVRSGFVESVHHGSVVVLDSAGAVKDSAGDVTSPVFPRSSNKPLQTVGMLRAGLRPREAADLALMSGSHLGEPFHARRAQEILAAAGLDAEALGCPPDLPVSPSARDAVLRAGGAAQRILMNCSGKHAGMLATCVVNGWPLASYRDAGHPLQVTLAESVTELAGEPIAATGVDGCGAPVFAFSLTALARSFLRLVDAEPGSAERRVADAMRAHPELVHGTGGDDTVLMAGVPGLLAKGGAEGVQAVAVPGVGAVAFKISDGAARARMPVLRAALRRLGVDGPVPEVAVLGGGEPVGEVRTTW